MPTPALNDLADQTFTTPTITETSQTILVIDDYGGALGVISSAVHQLGFHVISFGEAKLALDYLSAGNDAHLVISDLIMPLMGGCEFARSARLYKPELPFLFITGQSADRLCTHLKCRGRCCVSILPKPFNLGDLAGRVWSLIGDTHAGCPECPNFSTCRTRKTKSIIFTHLPQTGSSARASES